MDFEGEAHGEKFEVNFSGMDDSESDKSRKTQSSSLEVVSISADVNSSTDTFESKIKDASHAIKLDNNFVCETMQSEHVHESVELSIGGDVKITTDKCDKTNDTLNIFCKTINLVDASEATTSQENSSSSFHIDVSNVLHTDQIKAKRGISKGQVHANSNASIEKSDDSSDEDSSKRQKLNKSVDNIDAENVSDDTVTFQKTKSKVKQRNYRKRQNITSDNEDSSGNTSSSEAARENFELYTDEEEEYEEELPRCQKNEIPSIGIQPNWHIVPEVINRQIGSNLLFQRRFYGSLHAVERLELMYNLNEHQGCVNALNFNEKGNLLASASDDLTVVIWDWAVGKKRHSFMSGHTRNMFQAKWLPLDMEYLMVTCAEDGQVRLLDLEHNTSKRLAAHRAASHKLAVHPETPHIIFSAGEDARVFSIDIRERKPSRLLYVKEDSSRIVQLYSIHCNPFNSNEFCIGGRSQYVRVYDRRKVSTPLYKLCPNHLTENKQNAHVTCAVYNHDGTEILASYNDEVIYLFNRLLSFEDYTNRYVGHRNRATVKGVNFFGPKSEYVISGSDCGNIFIWEKTTSAVVQWMAGDKQGVVNCLEGHPHIPVLATSGLDYDVKIWVPSGREAPMMKSLVNCAKSNARNRKQENTPDGPDGQWHWVLGVLRYARIRERMRQLYPRQYEFDDPIGDDDDDDDDDDDYHFDDSSNDNLSDNTDSQSESGDVGRTQCPQS
ncbi:DDB1- and CUL4-associated factor 8-like [Formica exsecta]|uniref:DDB1- and CUL4-associated factor 8-like n=1 Tax=Formica exsecta TaxID=72781 RepID=UPI001142D9A9|nr:DDB1- and CUL4-associated factor 8-like [Formica exsecta]XP_029677297.1 DDB1- and CUL4-associated factor 8-like [Formica exsecta]